MGSNGEFVAGRTDTWVAQQDVTFPPGKPMKRSGLPAVPEITVQCLTHALHDALCSILMVQAVAVCLSSMANGRFC